MITDNYQSFLDEFFKLLERTGIDVDRFDIDHIAYYTDSATTYDEVVAELTEAGHELFSENIVGGRRVGIFTLAEPLEYEGGDIEVVEVIEPIENEQTTPRWEHVELISDMSLEEILEEYPGLDWDTSRIDREEFPMIKLKLNDEIQAKFPRRSNLEEASRA